MIFAASCIISAAIIIGIAVVIYCGWIHNRDLDDDEWWL